MSSTNWGLVVEGWVLRAQQAWEGIRRVLGLGMEELAFELTLEQMIVRVFLVYAFAVVVVRLGKKRILGKNTAFDFIVGIMLGSVLSRAITGNSPFLPTLGAGFVLMGLHWLFAAMAFRFDRFGTLIKGYPRLLVENGEIQWGAMKKGQITTKDLLEALRSQGQTPDLNKVKMAYLERSGDISVIPATTKPEVFEVAVSEGIQTVRVQLEHPEPSPRERQLQAHIAELERKIGQLVMENDLLRKETNR